MSSKKVIAALLAAAMVLTSSGFTTPVMAAQMADKAAEELVVESTEDMVSEVKSEEEVVSPNNKEENDDADAEVEKANDESGVKGNSSVDVTDETVEDKKVIDEEESEGDKTDSTFAEENEEQSEEIIDESELESEETVSLADMDETVESDNEIKLQGADDYFDVDEDGNLKKRPGVDMDISVTIPKECRVIPAHFFKNEPTIEVIYFESGSELTTIGEYAFKDSSITSIKIPAGVTVIKEGAFEGSALSSLRFADSKSITSIEDSAFEGSNITEIRLPNCTTIGQKAFMNCSQLRDVVMQKLETIEESAFRGCSNLGSGMIFYPSITYMGNNAFRGCGFTEIDFKSDYSDLSNLISKADGNGDQNVGATIRSGVFADNKKLETVTLTGSTLEVLENITYIPSSMFSGCNALTKVFLPDNVVTIGANAFNGCSALTKINLMDAKCIKAKAFLGCTSLTEVDFNFYDKTRESHISIAYDAFPSLDSTVSSKLVMKGYDEVVKDYAGDKGYTFESKFPKHNIEKNFTNISSSTITFAASARAGEEVIVTISGGAGVPIDRLYYRGKDTNKGSDLEFVSEDAPDNQKQTTQTASTAETKSALKFRFTMPDEDVTLFIEGVNTSTIKSSDLTLGFYEKTVTADSTYAVPEAEDGLEDVYTWTQKGSRAQIKVSANNKTGARKDYGSWLYTYSSSDTKVVKVDADGMLVGTGYGVATVTVTATYNKNVKKYLTISIEDDISIGQIYAGKKALETAKKLIDTNGVGTVTLDPVTGNPVVTLNKNSMTANQYIDINVEAYTWENDEYTASYNTGKNYLVKTNWKSQDTSIATVNYASVTNNKNRITVKKGAVGECIINISTVNEGENEPNGHNAEGYKEDNIAAVIIKVIDVNPRLVNNNITVNYQILKGTPITIVPVYGYEIGDDGENDELLVFAEKKTKNGVVTYEQTDATRKFVITYDSDDGYWYVTTKGITPALKSKTTYKNWYIKGKYSHKNGGTEFAIPVTSLTLTNEQLAPKITQTGTVNMFYNNTAGDEAGYVEISQSLTDYKVIGYELVSSKNNTSLISSKIYSEIAEKKLKGTPSLGYMTKNGVNVRFDSFAYNFDVITNEESVNNSKATIKRSKWFDDIAKVSNKDVVGGYLYIYYEGYRDPVRMPITVKTVNKAPEYVLSKTSVTVFDQATEQVFPLQLLDKKTKKPVSLAKTYIGTENPDGSISVNAKDYRIHYNNVKTTAKNLNGTNANGGLLDMTVWNDPNTKTSRFQGLANDYIRVKVNNNAKTSAGNAVISINMTTWSDPEKYLDYTCKINVVKSVTVKANTSKITMNRAYFGGTDNQHIELTTSTNDANVVNIHDLSYADYSNKPETAKAYAKVASLITLGGEGHPNWIYIGQPATEADAGSIPNGKYSFWVYPRIKTSNGPYEQEMDKISFTVTVTNTAPVISVGTLKFNVNAANEMPTSTLAIKNIINGQNVYSYSVIDNVDAIEYYGVEELIDPDNFRVSYYHTNKKWTKHGGFAMEDPEYDDSFENVIMQPIYNEAKPQFAGTKGDYLGDSNAGTYKVNGVWVKTPGGSVAKAAAYNMAITLNKKTPSVTVTQSGTINTILPASEIKITANIKEVTGTVSTAKVYEIRSGGSVKESHFYLYHHKDDAANVWRLRAKPTWTGKGEGWDSEALVPNKTYNLRVYWSITSMNGYTEPEDLTEIAYDAYTDFSVKPIRTFPKLTIKSTRTYAYAGQDRGDIYKVGTSITKNQWDIIVTAQVESAYRGTVILDKNMNGKFDDDVDVEVDKILLPIKNVDEPNSTDMVGWASNASSNIKNAFTLLPDKFSYNPKTGVIQFAVRLRDASELVQNKKYTLPFASLFRELQNDSSVYGNKFSIDVNVNK